MNEDPSTTPIPFVASAPLDLQKVVDDIPDGKPLSLADAVRQYNFCACLVCGRGGHTRHTLYTVIENLATRKEAKACKDHVGQFLRPKDLKTR